MLSLIVHGGIDAFLDYLSAHVLTCLVPAFFIAGAIGVFVSQASVLKYFGAQAEKIVSYSVASVSGTVLAVCSCTVLPLFSGIYQRGAGIGPATAFLYSGPLSMYWRLFTLRGFWVWTWVSEGLLEQSFFPSLSGSSWPSFSGGGRRRS